MEGQMSQPLILANTLSSSFEIPSKLSTKLIVLLPYCLLLLGADLTFFPFMGDVVTSMELLSKQKQDPNSLESKEIVERVLKDVWLLLGFEIFFLAFFWMVSLFSLLAMLYTSSRGELSLKELFSKSGRSWMRQVITWFYTTFIMFVSVGLVLVSINFSSLETTGLTVILLSLMFVMIGTLCYVYLAAVWMFSMVMFITELDLNEPMLVEKSEELTKGKRLQGFVVMLVMSVVGIIIVVGFVYEKRNNSGRGWGNGIMMLCYVCLLKIFMFVLYSMYCHESKRRNSVVYSPIESRNEV